MAGPKKVSSTYFEVTDPVYTIFTFLALGVLMAAWLFPNSQFFEDACAIGGFITWIGKQFPTVIMWISRFIIVAHSFEALVAMILCKRMGLTTSTTIKWMLQTMIVGYKSLFLLIWPRTNERKMY